MKFLIVLSFLFASSAYASDFSGTWSGSGDHESSSWGQFQAKVEIVVIQSGDQLNVRDCWSFVKDGGNWHVCSTNQFDLNGNEIWSNGLLVGNINGDAIEIAFSDASNSITAKATINSNQTLDYTYEAHDNQGGFIKERATGLVR